MFYILPCSTSKLLSNSNVEGKTGTLKVINATQALKYCCGKCLANQRGLAVLDETLGACTLDLENTQAILSTRRGMVGINNFETTAQ